MTESVAPTSSSASSSSTATARLQALVADYVQQAELLADVPMAVSPLTGTRSENLGGVTR